MQYGKILRVPSRKNLEPIAFGVIIAACLGMYFLYPWNSVDDGPANSAIVVSDYTTNRDGGCTPRDPAVRAGTPVEVQGDKVETTTLRDGVVVDATCAMPFVLPTMGEAVRYTVSIASRELGVRSGVELNAGAVFTLG